MIWPIWTEGRRENVRCYALMAILNRGLFTSQVKMLPSVYCGTRGKKAPWRLPCRSLLCKMRDIIGSKNRLLPPSNGLCLWFESFCDLSRNHVISSVCLPIGLSVWNPTFLVRQWTHKPVCIARKILLEYYSNWWRQKKYHSVKSYFRTTILSGGGPIMQRMH